MPAARKNTTARFLLYPAVAVSLNVGLAALLTNTYKCCDESAQEWLSIASSLSNLLSNASIAIVTLTFSLTVLSIQIASQTYSPRLLDDFLQDPISQFAVSVNLGAYAYSFFLQYWLFEDDNNSNNNTDGIPILAIHFLSIHMLTVLLMFVVFIHYFVNNFRLESILHRATEASWHAAQKLEEALSNQTGLKKDDEDLPTVPTTAYKVLADYSGYLCKYNLNAVVADATRLDLVIRYHPNIGEFVAEGSLLAYVWDANSTTTNASGDDDGETKRRPSFKHRVLTGKSSVGSRHSLGEHASIDNHQTELAVEEKLGRIIAKGLEITTARSGELDVLLGVQQLTDVAVRALSAAVNDPFTAVQALDYLSTLFGRLARLSFPIGCAKDKNGVVRCTSPRRSFAYLLSILDAIRFYGKDDLQVMYRLIRFYGDLGATVKMVGKYQDRISTILAQMEQCMQVCRDKYPDDNSVEKKSIQELYDYSMSLIVTSQAGRPMLQQNEAIEKDLTDLETTYVKPTSQFFDTLKDEHKVAMKSVHESSTREE
ncbi:Membrane [Seminavis robusta]|uniref:Membrane n=1 Tax=Seminavis robusta TaxID=568900 RepID=A0A9N8DKA1_9STRA|nr:Membrane [Seminavis robusta]|eukprot:Sro130_g061770.1 Membrane (541) ;mRNA; r:11284-12906